MNKPREFWVYEEEFAYGDLWNVAVDYKIEDGIHVREVVEISEAEINEAADELANYSCRRSAEDGIRWAIARLGGK